MVARSAASIADGAGLSECFIGGDENRFGFGARFDHLAVGEVLFGEVDGVFEHLFDVDVGDAVARLDFDDVLLVGAQVFGANLEDAVGVDQKFHFDASEAGGRGRRFELETREGAAIFREFALALQHVDVDGGLIVDAGGEELFGARGNRGVARNNFRDNAAHGFDAERERRHVEEQHGLHAAFENVSLHGGAERDYLIGVEFGVRRAAEIIADRFADERDARGAADEDDFFDIRGLELRVGHGHLYGRHGAGHDRAR